MLKHYQPIICLLTTIALVSSCVNQDYDFKNLENVNTDINFGGQNLAIPIGTIKPISLGEFLKPGELIKIVDGNYMVNYKGDNSTHIDPIQPISINAAIPDFQPIEINFNDISINDIDLPVVTLNPDPITAQFPTGVTGAAVTPITKTFINNSALEILYTFSEEIKQVNWITFGDDANSHGQILEFNIIAHSEHVLSSTNILFNKFDITFPYGFEIEAIPSDFYQGSISADKKTYSITNKTLDENQKIAFSIKKVTFDPSKDQNEAGKLLYTDNIKFSADIEIGGTATGRGGTVEILFEAHKKLNMNDGEFNTNIISAQSPAEKTPLNIDQALGTNMVKTLSHASLTNPTPITINITEKGLPAKVDQITFANYLVIFPEFLEFQDPEINRTKSLNLKGEVLKRGETFTKEILVTGYKFNTNPIRNENITLQAYVKTEGEISIPALNDVHSSDISTVTIQPTVTIGEMQIKTITGIVQPDMIIEPITIDINLDDDLDFIKESNVDLDRIALQLNIENSSQITSAIGITLTPKDQNNEPIAENVVTQNSGLAVNAQSKSLIWLSNSQTDMPTGFSFVENNQINHLLRKMPSTLEANISILENSHESTVDVTNQEVLKFNVNYEILAPLAVGQDFKLVYREHITDLQKELQDYIKYINNDLEITLQTVNEIPLDLSVSAVALDKQGNPLNVTLVVDGVIQAADKSEKPTTSKTKILITEKTKGELKKIDQIQLLLNGDANQTVAGAQLKENQTINIKTSARIPGGINVTL